MQKTPRELFILEHGDRQPVLLSVHNPMFIECSPEKIIESILRSRMSLEDKLAKFLANKFLSTNQKSIWVTRMIELGADVTTRHHVALRWAAEHGDLPLVQLTLQKGADIHCMKDEPLSRAALGGHNEVVECLIRQGADVHAKQDVAIRLAASMGHQAVITQLLKAQANPAAKQNEALRKAFDGGHVQVMRILLDTSAKVILDAAQSHKDWQVFAIVWRYAKEQQDSLLQDCLENYDYRPTTKARKSAVSMTP